MQNKKGLIIILCAVVVIFMAVLAVCAALILIQDKGPANEYQKQLDMGAKYVDEENYDQAIAAYLAAIDADPTSDEPYYRLALLYKDLNRLSDLQSILLRGIEATSSQRLKDLYVSCFGHAYDELDEDKNEEGVSLSISDSLTQIVANYVFDDYRMKYMASTSNIRENKQLYNFGGFNGTLYFFNEGSTVSIDETTNAPYVNVRPNYVVLNDLSELFQGLDAGESLSSNDLLSLGATEVQRKHDTGRGDYVRFIYNHCVVEIVLTNDSFTVTSENRVYSEFGTAAQSGHSSFDVDIKIVDATTGKGLADAELIAHEGNNVYGTVVAKGTTDSNGICTLELVAGSYCFEVIRDGYVTESFMGEVFSSGICSLESLIVSPQLAEGQIRIVLEWGDYPSDLDSYLVDNSGDVRVYYSNRQWSEGDVTVAELDVDDVDGYGPETITVNDTSKNFTYYVHDYSSTGRMFERQDITVKVYTPGSSAPTVFTINTQATDALGWCVFSYVDGRIVIQDTPVQNRSDFSYRP